MPRTASVSAQCNGVVCSLAARGRRIRGLCTDTVFMSVYCVQTLCTDTVFISVYCVHCTQYRDTDMNTVSLHSVCTQYTDMNTVSVHSIHVSVFSCFLRLSTKQICRARSQSCRSSSTVLLLNTKCLQVGLTASHVVNSHS